jgi:hypothetical protein
MPAVSLADLKPGATVVVSSPKGPREDQLTAIVLVANAGMLIQIATLRSGQARGRGDAAGNGMANGAMSGVAGGDFGALTNLGFGGIIP